MATVLPVFYREMLKTDFVPPRRNPLIFSKNNLNLENGSLSNILAVLYNIQQDLHDNTLLIALFFIIFWTLTVGPNLIPRILRLFGQKLVARRDSVLLECFHRRISANQKSFFFVVTTISLESLLRTNRWSKSLRTLGAILTGPELGEELGARLSRSPAYVAMTTWTSALKTKLTNSQGIRENQDR